MGEKIMYAVVLAAIAVLAFAVFAMPQGRQAGGVAGYASAGGQRLAGLASAQFAGGEGSQSQQAAIPSECGDINDPKNLQHLSHHPDQFQECYKFVDANKFRQAVGRDLSEFRR